MRSPGLVLAALLALGPLASAQEGAPARFAIASERAQGLLALELPESVLRRALDPQLADLRIFNASCEALAIGALPDAPAQATARSTAPVALRLVPLAREVQARERDLRELSLRVAQDGLDARIELTPGLPAPAPGADDDPGGYLLDLRPAQRAGGRLALEFAPDAPDFARRIEILGSEDLVDWQPLADGPLTRNRQLEVPVDEREFALALTPSFARIGWSEGPAPRLIGASLTPPASAEPLPRAALAVIRGEQPDTCYAQVPVALRIERIHVRTPLPNSSVRLRVDRHDGSTPGSVSRRRRSSPVDPWIPVTARLDVFRLQRDGREVEGEPLAFPYRTSRLRLRTLAGEAFGDALPIVEAQWRAQRIVFVAREPAPYTLVVGDPDAPPGPVIEASAVVASDDPYGLRLPVATIASADSDAAPPATAAFEERVRRESAPRIALWGILVLAVLALAAMALRIAAQLRSRAGSPGSDSPRPPAEPD